MLAGLRALLARGKSLRDAEIRLKRPRSTLGDLAKRENLTRRPRAGLSPEKLATLKRLLAKGLGGRQAARQAGISRETVWKHQQLAKFRGLIARANTPLPCRPWRCPGGGELLCVSVCIVHGCRKPVATMRPKTKRRTGKTRRKAG